MRLPLNARVEIHVEGCSRRQAQEAVEEMAKAVGAHRSQVQPRDLSGRFSRTPARPRPRNAAGRFLGRLTLEEREEATRLAGRWGQELHARLAEHLNDAAAGRLSPEAATVRAGRDLDHFYELIYREGQRAAGWPAVTLTPQDRAIVNRHARDEAGYFRRFLSDAAEAREGRMDDARRLAYYRSAARSMYWAGWATGDGRPGRRITWVLGPTEESCGTCSDMAGHGPWTVADFLAGPLAEGHLPQSGDLDCKGLHCQCYLVESEEAASA